MIVTIDGPSGTGKTTVAKEVAGRLHFTYFDTGAMYRALTWLFLQEGISFKEKEKIDHCVKKFAFHIREEKSHKCYYVGDTDVTREIRSPEVTKAVSSVSALPEVRASLLLLQHRFASSKNVVFEGRDLGTVVFPEAEFKVFLTADPEVRAKRRLQEILSKNPEAMQKITLSEVLQDLNHRDELDSTRDLAPLRCPKGAFVIHTSIFTIDEVVDKIVTEYNRLYS